MSHTKAEPPKISGNSSSPVIACSLWALSLSLLYFKLILPTVVMKGAGGQLAACLILGSLIFFLSGICDKLVFGKASAFLNYLSPLIWTAWLASEVGLSLGLQCCFLLTLCALGGAAVSDQCVQLESLQANLGLKNDEVFLLESSSCNTSECYPYDSGRLPSATLAACDSGGYSILS